MMLEQLKDVSKIELPVSIHRSEASRSIPGDAADEYDASEGEEEVSGRWEWIDLRSLKFIAEGERLPLSSSYRIRVREVSHWTISFSCFFLSFLLCRGNQEFADDSFSVPHGLLSVCWCLSVFVPRRGRA